jgi:hypothetical protein
MTDANNNPAEELKTPVFPKTIHELRPKSSEGTPPPNSQKRDNIFSKSRDTRENRGTRQAKTERNSRTQPHGR